MRTRADHIVLWPSYFDSRKRRSRGRRVPRNLAVERPSVQEVARAAGMLDLNPRILEEKSYPASWWEREGCVYVDRAMPKTEMLRRVALKLKDIRGSQ